jgi:hypothetical protein
MYLHTYLLTYARLYVFMFVCIYVCKGVCVCMYEHKYVRTYACSHVCICYDAVQSRTQVPKFSEEIQINLILYQYARRKPQNTIFFIVTTLVM